MFLLSGWFRNKAKGLEPFATFLCSFLFLELIILCMMNSISTCVYFLSFFTTKMQYVSCGHCMYNESVFSARLQQNLANFSYQSSKYSHFGLCGHGLALPQLSYTNSSLQSICSSLTVVTSFRKPASLLIDVSKVLICNSDLSCL